MVQRVRAQASQPNARDDRIVRRLLCNLDVNLIIRLLKVDIVHKGLCHETAVSFGLTNRRHEAIREAEADSLQVLAIVTLHEQVRQLKRVVLVENRQVAFFGPLEAQISGVGMRAKHLSALEGVKTD